MMKNLLTLFTLLLISTFTYGQSIGIIGSATPDGWDADTDMTQDMSNPDMWTISMTLTEGAVKFRQDDAWDVNWGSSAFPTGVGTQGGNDIPTFGGGNFDITFNTATGEYSFVSTDVIPYTSIGLIGEATPIGDWNTDTNLVQIDSIPWVYELEVELVMGPAKFRADDDWTNSWGADSFPTGIGALGGDNIPVDADNNYKVTFNAATGYYNFETLVATYSTIGIIGDATAGGWNDDTDMVQSATDPNVWTLTTTIMDGELKFRAENAWDVSWGDTGFPVGTGTLGGPNIPVVAGEYLIEFNSFTGEYAFKDPLAIYSTIGIIGSALPTMWDSDVDMFPDPANPDDWSITVVLTDGELKFRADNAWDTDWGDVGFPTGTGTQGGSNIGVFAGTWEIKLNATSGVYSFTPVSVGTIGPASPTNGWDTDEDMTHSATERNFWTGVQTLTAGEIKFRQNDDWGINWGATDFPTGVGIGFGPNIPVPTDGTYEITLEVTQPFSYENTTVLAEGNYSFIEVSSTENPFSVRDVKLSPNPTSDVLNIQIDAEIEGDVKVIVMDMTGKLVYSGQYEALTNLALDVSNYAQGTYAIQLVGDYFVIGKKFVVAK